MQAIEANFGEVPSHRGGGPRQGLPWLLPWSLALAFGAGMGGWVMHARPAAAPDMLTARSADDSPFFAAEKASNPYGGLVNPQDSLVSPYGPLVDFFPDSRPALALPDSWLRASLEAAPPASVAAIPPQGAPLPPKRAVAAIDATAPLPPPRPAELGSNAAPAQPGRSPQPDDKTAVATPPADDRSIFQKLFGLERPSAAVAYATPEGRVAGSARLAGLAATDRASVASIFGRSPPPPGYDKFTAVYDISARTVYLPDGTRLEAHSGLGDKLDDPRYVSEHTRGATPPHLYDLTMREDLFHGVQALRLEPIGDGDVFGRAGLLAHPYMLGPNGDSNGCVSVKDYDAFLRAYQQGQVKRLAVVAKLD